LRLLLSFDDDTSRTMERVVCTAEDCLRTSVLLLLFATRLTAASAEHEQARRWMAEVRRTTNPVRLLVLVPKIHSALETALAREPENVEVHLDLVRFYVTTPSIAGGDVVKARTHAAEIARRDIALGHFARGYIAYREAEYGPGRYELREAIRLGTGSTRALAVKWLGWLSQETQQWDEAFAMFEELRATDASALYEIGRTAVFCKCRVEQGRTALQQYLKKRPSAEMPTIADARKQLRKLQRR
jgi:tetratricopeptide (TPR) repeat protein